MWQDMNNCCLDYTGYDQLYHFTSLLPCFQATSFRGEWPGSGNEASWFLLSYCCLPFLLSDAIIIDACSVERNRILVSCYFIGGPNERKLPPHFLMKVWMWKNYLIHKLLVFLVSVHVLVHVTCNSIFLCLELAIISRVACCRCMTEWVELIG